MSNENEVLEVGDIEVITDDEGNDITDYKTIALERQELAKKNFGIAKRFQTKLEKSKVEEQKPVEKPIEKQIESNEPDYAKIAYLNSLGNTNPDDQKWVMEEANRLKLPLTDILNMEHAKIALKNAKDQREAQAGMPKGGGRGGNNTQQDVDYWLAKGETPDDLGLAKKVIDAKVNKEQNKNIFSEELFTG